MKEEDIRERAENLIFQQDGAPLIYESSFYIFREY